MGFRSNCLVVAVRTGAGGPRCMACTDRGRPVAPTTIASVGQRTLRPEPAVRIPTAPPTSVASGVRHTVVPPTVRSAGCGSTRYSPGTTVEQRETSGGERGLRSEDRREPLDELVPGREVSLMA